MLWPPVARADLCHFYRKKVVFGCEERGKLSWKAPYGRISSVGVFLTSLRCRERGESNSRGHGAAYSREAVA